MGTSFTRFAENLADIDLFYCNFKLYRQLHSLGELTIKNLDCILVKSFFCGLILEVLFSLSATCSTHSDETKLKGSLFKAATTLSITSGAQSAILQ